jgi:hypothetical protein
MGKPQALFMPEASLPDDLSAPADANTSIEAYDGDVSIDSNGGYIVSQGRDVRIHRNRQEVDEVVVKCIRKDTDDLYQQYILLIVELKRDDLTLREAIDQIQGYLGRALFRNNATNARRPKTLLGLLILGEKSIRLEVRPGSQTGLGTFIDGTGDDGIPNCVGTDSEEVHTWLINQANEWAHIETNDVL